MPDPARIESWKKTLSSWQVSYIERECQHEMRRLGYAPSGVFLERRPWLELVAPLVVDIRIVYRYLIYWPEYVFYTLLRKAVMGLFRMLRVKA